MTTKDNEMKMILWHLLMQIKERPISAVTMSFLLESDGKNVISIAGCMGEGDGDVT